MRCALNSVAMRRSTSNLKWNQTQSYYLISSLPLHGALSGVLGGLTRDVLCQVPPVLLHRETSGTVSVLGAIVYVVLYKLGQDSLVNAVISGLVIVLLRLLSVKLKINLPKLI